MSEDATRAINVRSVERACALLGAFSMDKAKMTLTELASRTGLPKPTIYRLAGTLVAGGFMSQALDGSYAPGYRLIELGAIVHNDLDVVRRCAPVVSRLARETVETVLVAIPDWEAAEILVVDRRDSAHALSIISPPGRRSPIPLGSLGKALLSGLSVAERHAMLQRLPLDGADAEHPSRALHEELEHARRVGYAIEVGEYLRDVSGVAVPVLFENGRPRCTIGIVGPSTRLDPTSLAEFGARLVDATHELSEAAR